MLTFELYIKNTSITLIWHISRFELETKYYFFFFFENQILLINAKWDVYSYLSYDYAYITSRVKGLKRWTVLYVNKLWVYAQTHRHTSKHVNMGHAKKNFSALLIRSVKSYPLVEVKKKSIWDITCNTRIFKSLKIMVT